MSRNLPNQLDVVDDDMVQVLRQKSEAERLAIAHDIWTYARNMILHVVRGEHPPVERRRNCQRNGSEALPWGSMSCVRELWDEFVAKSN